VTGAVGRSRIGVGGVKAIALSTGPSDQDLVLLMRRRQAGAFDEVYRRHRERIWRFLHRLAGQRALAEDLFQDTWLAAARNAHRLHEDSQILPWLYTIARNKHRNSLRFTALEQRRRSEAGALADPAPVPEADVEAHTGKCCCCVGWKGWTARRPPGCWACDRTPFASVCRVPGPSWPGGRDSPTA
jgi:hypothetical protein